MISVLVVEDEPPIRRSIVRCIEQRGSQFDVVGTAMNGRQALELLSKTGADVVFTDIRMPVMDGLELARELRTLRPEVAVVIISGYQDFVYMRQALVSQVTDYLLKPVTIESMNPVLDRLAEKIGTLRQAQKRRELEAAIGQTDDGIPVSDSAGEVYGAYLICAGAYPLVDDTLLPARAFWNTVDLEKRVNELLLPGESCMCFTGKSSAEMVALVRLGRDTRLGEIAQTLWERLGDGAKIAVTVGSVERLLAISEIGGALRGIRQRLHTEMRLFSPSIIWDAAHESRDLTALPVKRFERELGEAITARDKQALERLLLDCVGSFARASAAEIQLVHFLESILNAHSNLLDTQTANFKLELRASVSNATDADALARDVAYIFTNIFERPGEEREREPALILQIEQFMRTHFESSITNTVLSERFGFVPSYISKLFRIHRGVSPSEFLTRYRIERAKELMSQEPELLFKEVASRVGFSDQYYFSKIFKKETGEWPTEFVKRK